MNTERHLDPPDFETVEEILEGCFTQEQAQEVAECKKFIDWYDCAGDEDISAENDAKYARCKETVSDILDEILSNCQDYDLSEEDIINLWFAR